jgi:hypothetical protein
MKFAFFWKAKIVYLTKPGVFPGWDVCGCLALFPGNTGLTFELFLKLGDRLGGSEGSLTH